MSIHRTHLLASLALVGGAMLFVVKATGQATPAARNTPPTQIVQETVLEETSEGTYVPRTVVRQRGTSSGAGAPNPYASGYRPQVPVYVDPEVALLHQAEINASEEAARLAEQIRRPGGDTVENRQQLQEKLSAIFDLQQKRRGHEVATIEARLNKLKDIMQKREAAKDSIVDRRLEVLTGGIDELGWEETEPLPARLPVPVLEGVFPRLEIGPRSEPQAESRPRVQAHLRQQPGETAAPRRPESRSDTPSAEPAHNRTFPRSTPEQEPESAEVEPPASEPEVSR